MVAGHDLTRDKAAQATIRCNGRRAVVSDSDVIGMESLEKRAEHVVGSEAGNIEARREGGEPDSSVTQRAGALRELVAQDVGEKSTKQRRSERVFGNKLAESARNISRHLCRVEGAEQILDVAIRICTQPVENCRSPLLIESTAEFGQRARRHDVNGLRRVEGLIKQRARQLRRADG